MSITLKEIAESIESDESYSNAYKRQVRKNEWLEELLQQAYMEMGENFAFVSTKSGKEYISYSKAAKIMDKTVLTVVAIYQTYIERNKCSPNSVS